MLTTVQQHRHLTQMRMFWHCTHFLAQLRKRLTISTSRSLIYSISINKLQPLAQSESACREKTCTCLSASATHKPGINICRGDMLVLSTECAALGLFRYGPYLHPGEETEYSNRSPPQCQHSTLPKVLSALPQLSACRKLHSIGFRWDHL